MTGSLHLILIAATLSTSIAASPCLPTKNVAFLLHGAYCVETYSPSKGVQMVLVVKRDPPSTIGTMDLHGLSLTGQHVKGSAMYNASLLNLVLFEDTRSRLSRFGWYMGIPKSFLEKGDIEISPYGFDKIVLGGRLSFSYTACYVSLLDQDFCSHNGYRVTFGSKERLSNVGAVYDSTCTISKDGRELGKFDMHLSDSDYILGGFSISLIKTPYTNFTKLLEAFDPNFEESLKRFGEYIYPSQESYWTGNRALAYDFLHRELHLQLVDGLRLPFVPC
ncbi:hypothetical protein FOL47_009010 [Perkinsus chesapeaki]|uniref:Uncharacterized protein n=1 Tax=Perkinsus chesapeaki TaxID=330153 RepID=A0A7J6LAX9_PERCH|nr:hypothetical protein FOL47_009010 [Perkinsus chesapeaki]